MRPATSMWTKAMNLIFKIIRHLTDIMAPRSCAVCDRRMSPDESAICARCDMRLPRTGHETDMTGNEMARLFWARIAVERAAAMWLYQPHSEVSALIYRLKYGNRPEQGRQMGIAAARELKAAGFFDGIDLIIPVPLAREKMMQRGYNQSEEIARGVAAVTGLPVVTEAVTRIRNTESQTSKTGVQRVDNVEGAFRLMRPDRVAGRHVLIVDDVVTTGSTVCACGKELMKAGGVSISVMSLGFTHQ